MFLAQLIVIKYIFDFCPLFHRDRWIDKKSYSILVYFYPPLAPPYCIPVRLRQPDGREGHVKHSILKNFK
jgi:hypothetical protein